ncbi:MAG: hypothetical protein ABWZ66_13425 [Pyrinomonadaceae bacterium]
MESVALLKKKESVNSFIPAQYSTTDKANYLLRNGSKMSGLFGVSAYLKKDSKALAIADCLSETYKPENVYVSRDVVNYQTGEIFDGYGILQNGVASRISPAYQQSSSRRARKKVQEKVSTAKPLVGYHWRFATFTMPHLRADVQTVLAIESRAVELLKKRKIWRDNIQGAFLGQEMTIGDGSTKNSTHYHVHTHALLLAKYVEQWKLADVWTECVETACKEFGVDFVMTNLKTNRLVVDIRDVRKYTKKRSIKMDDAVIELCKYTTKGSDFEKVPAEELVEIEYALRGRQMVKTYGCFNSQKGKGKKKNSTKDTSVHNPHITDAKVKFVRNERKVKSLVKLGEEMISQGKREDWLKVLRITMEARRDFRRKYLAMKYPHAVFKTLDGQIWKGVSRVSTNH